jgi:hypothetical protein
MRPARLAATFDCPPMMMGTLRLTGLAA